MEDHGINWWRTLSESLDLNPIEMLWHELIVQQNRAKFYKNCGVYGKSTKFGTMIVYDIINNIGYRPHRDLSHNCKYSIFNFLHKDSSMEMRLSQTIPN